MFYRALTGEQRYISPLVATRELFKQRNSSSLKNTGAATAAAPSYTANYSVTAAIEASKILIEGSTLNLKKTGITIDGKTVSLGSFSIVVGGTPEAI